MKRFGSDLAVAAPRLVCSVRIDSWGSRPRLYATAAPRLRRGRGLHQSHVAPRDAAFDKLRIGIIMKDSANTSIALRCNTASFVDRFR